MPRIDPDSFEERQDRENVIRVKTSKPRNPFVQDMFDGKFPPKRHKDKRHKIQKTDKRNMEY